MRHASPQPFTQAQKTYTKLLCEGNSYKEIADLYNTTKETICNRVYEVRQIIEVEHVYKLIAKYYTDEKFKELINS